jgi:cytochrome c-type biogenesis protein CcmH
MVRGATSVDLDLTLYFFDGNPIAQLVRRSFAGVVDRSMFLWIFFAVLAAAVATLLLRRSSLPLSNEPDANMAVYRDQLAAIEAQLEQGLIDPQLAVSARAEVGRRLLEQAKIVGASLPASPNTSSDRLLTLAAIAIPLVSIALYARVGSPSLPGRPLAERLSADVDQSSPTDLIAKVEARLRNKPEDGQGWAVIAPIYLSQGRAVDAAQAYGRAMALIGETPERLAGFGKASVVADNGIVGEPARKAYERLLALEPDRVEAKYWLAVAQEQNGNSQAATEAYRALLSAAPADAPWRKSVEDRLSAIAANGANKQSLSPGVAPPKIAPAAGDRSLPPSGPTPAEFVAAAQKLPPEMREQMIGRMVTKAIDTLRQNPKDAATWSRLVTGYMALGKTSEALASVNDARVALVGDSAALSELDALTKNLSIQH